ncbi:MAG: response regulator transcription factor [Pseudomonadota bacterium]
MKVLIADDDVTSRCMLESMLADSGYEVVAVGAGKEALQILQAQDSPKLAILDWMMPDMDGIDVCHAVRQNSSANPAYIILLTVLGRKQRIIEGLNAGANDYISKPFDNDELKARLAVGKRVVELQATLSAKVNKLEEALMHVKKLQGLLPICMHCHSIHVGKDSWQRIEAYLSEQGNIEITHGLCPKCEKEYYSDIKGPKSNILTEP